MFWVTLATALRVNEVHALSARQDCLRRNIDGSITLLTFPGFVAKNKLPSADAQRVTLHPLLDCPTLCPVRVLEDYLARTKTLRSDNSQLFLSLRNPRTGSSPTLRSHWVRGMIQAAYGGFCVLRLRDRGDNSLRVLRRVLIRRRLQLLRRQFPPPRLPRELGGMTGQ